MSGGYLAEYSVLFSLRRISLQQAYSLMALMGGNIASSCNDRSPSAASLMSTTALHGVNLNAKAGIFVFEQARNNKGIN
jgi:hypothetical protein